MSFTHMGAGLASPDPSSSQMYRRGVLIHCPAEFSVDIVPPVKEGSSWHYGLRVKPPPNMATSPGGKRVKGYEIHRKWEDCLDLQRLLEKEYTALAKARKGKQGKKGQTVYGHPQRAASFDSLPTGPDPKTIPTDIHAFIPRLAAKSSLFRGASGSALVQQRSEEFNEFISALFAPGVPALVDETRQTSGVRGWFGFWRRDRDAMRRRDGEGPNTRRLSSSPSEVPPVPMRNQDASPFTSSPLAQTSYASTPIDLGGHEPRPSHETTYGDLASALDTFPMPPVPPEKDLPIPHPSISTSGGIFVPIVQRRLVRPSSRGEVARNTSFRNAQFFSNPPTPPLPPLPAAVAVYEGGYESEPYPVETARAPQADGAKTRNGRPRRATSPSASSASMTLTHRTPPSASPRSSQTSNWSAALNIGVVQTLAGSESASERDMPSADERSEIERMREMSLSSLSSPRPPPVPPRSNLRRLSGSAQHVCKQSEVTLTVKTPVPALPGEIPTVVYDQEEPEFEIVTHTVLNSYLQDARMSLLPSEYAMSSNSGSSIRRSITPSIASGYSTSSGGRESVSSAVPQPTPVPAASLAVPTPSTPVAPVHANEIILKAVCPIGDSIIICRVSRSASLAAVRGTLATKFRQAAGVQLDLLKHGFVLGYLNQQPRPGRPGTSSGRPGTASGQFGAGPRTPARSNGRPGTAPSGGRSRSSSLSSVAACADPVHLTLIVTQKDWENAVTRHEERMTVRVLLAGTD